MTREEWLLLLQEYMRTDARLYHASRYGTTLKLLSSFPSRATRHVQVGDLVRDADGSTLGLVSPLLSSSLEVATVVYWLIVRRDYVTGGLTSRRAADSLAGAGFNAPFTRCVPTEELIDRLASCVETVVANYGEYPAADVNLTTRPTQSTRLLKVMCNNIHEPYIVRMSASQFDRGAPMCGVCRSYMYLG